MKRVLRILAVAAVGGAVALAGAQLIGTPRSLGVFDNLTLIQQAPAPAKSKSDCPGQTAQGEGQFINDGPIFNGQ